MKKIFSFLTAILFVGSMWATTYSVTVDQNKSGNNNVHITTTTANSYQDVSYNDVTWRVAWTGAGVPTSGNKNQCQFGTSTNKCETLRFSTSDISGTITSVKVTTWGASSTAASCSVTVGTTVFQDSEKQTSVALNNTSGRIIEFTGSASGTISIDWSQSTAKAIYVSKIEVTYSASTNPFVAANPVSLDFGTVELNSTPATQTFALTGSNLDNTHDVTVSAPAGFKISIGEGEPAASVAITPSSKAISATIIVTPVTSAAGTFNNNITISSDDLSEDSTVAVSLAVVNPVAVESIDLSKTELTLADGESETLTATVLPAEATNKAVTWLSGNEAIATVDENGKVTGVASGNTTITCKSVADNTITASCAVTVKGPDIILDFSDNTNWGFPTTAKSTAEATYTSGDYSVKVSAGCQYYSATTEGPAALLVGKTDAYVVLPLLTDTAIAKVVTDSVANGSGTVTFNVYQGNADVSTEVTSCKVRHEFVIYPKKKNVAHSIIITNNQNARFNKIRIYFGPQDKATAVDNTDASVKAMKVMREGQIFILRGDKTYTVQGQLVK